MKEIWKDIKNYEGRYQISNLGRVKSLGGLRKSGRGFYNFKDRILKIRIQPNGYVYYDLHINKTVKRFYCHRLVAQSFIKNSQYKKCVNHIDGIKGNNYFKNLEWVTYSENHLHAYKYGLKKQSIGFGENHIRTKLSKKDTNDIKELYSDTNLSQTAISKIYNVSVSTISLIIKGNHWSCR